MSTASGAGSGANLPIPRFIAHYEPGHLASLFLFVAILTSLISIILFKLLWAGMTNIFISSPFTVNISELNILAAFISAPIQRKPSLRDFNFRVKERFSFTNITLTTTGGFKSAWNKSSPMSFPKLTRFVSLVRGKLLLRTAVAPNDLWNKKLRWS